MKVTVIGLGHVGLVAAAGLALAGHEALATDIDRAKLDEIRGGRTQFFEPGLWQAIAAASRNGTLKFAHTDEFRKGVGDIALVAVGTPPAPGHPVGLDGVMQAISWIKENATGSPVVVMKSTVLPGTGMDIIRRELAGTGLGIRRQPRVSPGRPGDEGLAIPRPDSHRRSRR